MVYFVHAPPGVRCVTANGEPGVWRLNLMMQGMRPAARFADTKLDEYLLQRGIEKPLSSQRLYTLNLANVGRAVFLIYADDGQGFAEPKSKAASYVRESIEQHHTISRWGPLEVELGFEIKRDLAARTIKVTATRYIEDGARRFLDGDISLKPKMPCTASLTRDETRTLPDPNTPTYTGDVARCTFMRRLVGFLLHVKQSRHELALPCSIIGQHVHHAAESDVKDGKLVMHYLVATKLEGSLYHGTVGAISKIYSLVRSGRCRSPPFVIIRSTF